MLADLDRGNVGFFQDGCVNARSV